MPTLVVTKPLFDNYMSFMPNYHMLKVQLKYIIFWAFCRQKNKIKIRVHAQCPYMGIRIGILRITLSRKMLFSDAQEIIYQIGYFLGGWGA